MKKTLTLTQTQAVIIAALLTATIGGYFAIKAATDPVKMVMEATQTAEARSTNLSAIDRTQTALNESIATQGAVATKLSQTERALVMTLTAVNQIQSMTSQASLSSTGTIEPRANAIGIMEMNQRNYGTRKPFQDRIDRLSNLGYSVTPVVPSLNLDGLLQFQLIYLPYGWGLADDSWFSDLLENTSNYRSYVYKGGNLIVESAGQVPGRMLKILPSPITFTSYSGRGCSFAQQRPYMVIPTHPLVTGLSNEDLGSSQEVIHLDSAYEVIVEDDA